MSIEQLNADILATKTAINDISAALEHPQYGKAGRLWDYSPLLKYIKDKGGIRYYHRGLDGKIPEREELDNLRASALWLFGREGESLDGLKDDAGQYIGKDYISESDFINDILAEIRAAKTQQAFDRDGAVEAMVDSMRTLESDLVKLKDEKKKAMKLFAYLKNREKHLAYCRAYNQQNGDRIRAATITWNASHRREKRLNDGIYRERNREKYNKYMAEYMAKKRAMNKIKGE